MVTSAVDGLVFYVCSGHLNLKCSSYKVLATFLAIPKIAHHPPGTVWLV